MFLVTGAVIPGVVVRDLMLHRPQSFLLGNFIVMHWYVLLSFSVAFSASPFYILGRRDMVKRQWRDRSRNWHAFTFYAKVQVDL